MKKALLAAAILLMVFSGCTSGGQDSPDSGTPDSGNTGDPAPDAGNQAANAEIAETITRDEDKTQIIIYSDGTATAQVDPDLKIWTDTANPTSEFAAEQAEAQDRETIRTNMQTAREIPSERLKITKAYLFDSADNYDVGQAQAVIACEGQRYFLIDLIGFSTQGAQPVIVTEFADIAGTEVADFTMGMDSNETGMGTLESEMIYAVSPDGTRTRVYSALQSD